MKTTTVNVGVIGLGTVGSGMVQTLQANAATVRQRSGADIVIRRVVEIDRSRVKKLGLPAECCSSDYHAVLDDPDIQVVVELVGGTTVAREIVMGALRSGRHVVTANKALLAKHWNEIFTLANKRRCAVGFEASVMAGVPIMRSLREGLAGNLIQSMHCILNGTTNFVLTRMSEMNEEYDHAIAEARARGYCEADASLDTEGFDAAQKLSILGSIAQGKWLPPDAVHRQGISQVERRDLEDAKQYFGYVMKPLAVYKRRPEGIEAHVAPTFVPLTHPLATMRYEYNAALIQADKAGLVMLAGKGAGSMPAASGVVSDVIAIARAIAQGAEPSTMIPLPPVADRCRVRPIEQTSSKFYLRFSVLDSPGVLSFISGALGRRKVSIATLHQRLRAEKGAVPILMITHEARIGDLRKALDEIDANRKVVKRKTIAYRIEEE